MSETFVVSCPGCSKQMRTLPYAFRVDAKRVSADEAEAVDPNPRPRHSKKFSCPCCGKQLQLVIEMRVVEVLVCESASNKPSKRTARRRTSNIDIIVAAPVVLEAFDQALLWNMRLAQEEGKIVGNKPKNMARFFHNFCMLQKPFTPANQKLAYCVTEDCKGELEFRQAMGIAVVLHNGQIHRFLPARLLHATHKPDFNGHSHPIAIQSLGRDPRIQLPKNSSDYLKSRNGYVPEGHRMFEYELRRPTTLNQ